MTSPGRPVRLGLFLFATGYHPAGWRLPEAEAAGATSPAFLHRIAQTVERAKFDYFFLGDGLATSADMQYRYPSQMARLEPFTMMGSIAAATRRVGLVVTANTTYSEPYNVARMLASLDYLSAGRIAWNVVTGADGRAAANFGREEHWATDQRYDRAEEFITVVRQLWGSWEDGALRWDKSTGEFVAGDKVHAIGHQGQSFSVSGPLNVPRPPQGWPPLVQAGTSGRSRDLAARFADIVFTAQPTVGQAQEFRSDIRARARALGRDPDQIAVMPGLVPIVGETQADAERLYDRMNALVVGDDRSALFGVAGAKLGEHPFEGPLPAGDGWPDQGHALAEYVELAEASIGRRVTSVRELCEFYTASGRGHRLVVGGTARVADLIQEWHGTGAADGFNICPAYLPGGLDRFVELVVPELQRRGIFRRDYEGPTFRAILGLPRPD